MENDHCIAVTHFINPHLFWYTQIGDTSKDYLHVLRQLEEQLQDLYRNKPLLDTFCRPAVGDKVAVNFVAWNKFIRAEILQKAQYQKEEFVAWAIDYGFPFLTKKEYVRTMPTELGSKHFDHIHCAGIVNVEPAVQEFNIEESDLVMSRREQWSQKPCDMLEKLLSNADSISFVIQYKTSEPNQNWGDLLITNHKGVKFNAREYLLKTTHALEVTGADFRHACLKLKTTQIAPWLSNDRKTKFKINSIKHNYLEYSKQVNSNMIDESAKRKVEDWQARNEGKQVDALSESLDNIIVSSNDNTIDDITFDDSVSVINRGTNYIGKAGALSKIKQQKYLSKNALPPPPSIDLNAFHLDSAFALNSSNDIPWPSEDENKRMAKKAEDSSKSSSTNVSIRIQKLAEMRAKHARTQQQQQQQEKEDSLFEQHLHGPKQQELPLIGSATTSNASVSTSVSLRVQKLRELRKKYAQAEEEKNKLAKEIEHNVACGGIACDKITPQHFDVASNDSNGSGTSLRVQKLTDLRKKLAREEENKKKFAEAGCRPKESVYTNNTVTTLPSQSVGSFDTSTQYLADTSVVSSGSGVSLRMQKLFELRKKYAREQEEKKKLAEAAGGRSNEIKQNVSTRVFFLNLKDF